MQKVPRTVFMLGMVSLFTDMSAEMIYPLLPLFLTTVLDAGAIAIGIIEGVAEATASLLKLVSGIWSDSLTRRKPLIVGGYALAGAMRPLIALANSWGVVLGLRFMDRVGKGIRTSPRDALIADVTPHESRGAAYGLHRAMDHAGAVTGPLIASAILAFTAVGLRDIFLFAAIPAVISVMILLFGVKETPRDVSATQQSAANILKWNGLGGNFKRFLAALFVFTLGNATDAFILLRLSDVGLSAGAVAVLWSLHHVVKAVSTYFGGLYSDRFGRRLMILAGWFIYAISYFGFAMCESKEWLIFIFLAYGLRFGLTEPSERAFVSDLVASDLRGAGFGYYHLVVGIGALPSSIMFGLIWHSFGAPAAFFTGAAFAASASALLFSVKERGIGEADRHPATES